MPEGGKSKITFFSPCFKFFSYLLVLRNEWFYLQNKLVQIGRLIVNFKENEYQNYVLSLTYSSEVYFSFHGSKTRFFSTSVFDTIIKNRFFHFFCPNQLLN